MFGKLVYDQKPATVFATFQGAAMEIDDDGRITQYTPRGEIVINVGRINAYYDHTILTGGHKIRVMETLEEIRKRLSGR